MAKINGQEFNIKGKGLSEIGDMLIDWSPNRDGKGLFFEITSIETLQFELMDDMADNVEQAIGYSLVTALLKRKLNPEGLKWKMEEVPEPMNFVFKTE